MDQEYQKKKKKENAEQIKGSIIKVRKYKYRNENILKRFEWLWLINFAIFKSE